MKTALVVFFMSASAFAGTCFVRTAELVTNEVSLAREICITRIDVKLDAFGMSRAVIKYTRDGAAAEKTADLTAPTELADGRLAFKGYALDRSAVGGACDRSAEAEASATLVMKRDGSRAAVEAVSARVYTSPDNCHAGFSTVQVLNYEKH